MLTISLSSLVCFLIYFSPPVHYLFLLIAGLNSVHPGKECSRHGLRKVEFNLHERQKEDEFVFSHLFGVLRFVVYYTQFCHGISSRSIPPHPCRSDCGNNLLPGCFVSRRSFSLLSRFFKETIQKKSNNVVFPFVSEFSSRMHFSSSGPCPLNCPVWDTIPEAMLPPA